MTIDLNKLNSMAPDALRTLAIQQGLSPHHKLGKDKLVKLIIEKVTTPVMPKPDGAPVVKPQAAVHHNTPEMVEAAIAAIKARQPRFVSSYGDDNTWLFQCMDSQGKVGCEESGNLSIPLRLIVRQANSVSQGRRALLGLNNHFDSVNASGKNAYTATVLGG